MPSINRLIRAESYAYQRWLASGCTSGWWRHLAAALNARIKAHAEYRGRR
jgi:hypothetical protein